ncbi:MAG: hypothetical protein AB8G18_02650 [Gammaproteobacteria bacterium]
MIRIYLTAAIAALLLFATSAQSKESTATNAQPVLKASQTETKEGWLAVLWGDPPAESGESVRHVYTLVDARGNGQPISISSSILAQSGGIDRLNGRYVKVVLSGKGSRDIPDIPNTLGLVEINAPADALYTNVGNIDRMLSGSKPWITVTCQFPDIADQPRDVNYFQEMYDNLPGRLDDYWREVSHNNIDIEGSLAIDWVELPSPQSTYVPTPGSGQSADLNRLFNDCVAAVDDVVDFSNGGTGGYEGINLMFNSSLDCCAWGGSRFATLDGISKSWRTTWNPPFSYLNAGIIAHEMGHGFGLPHANNSDNDNSPYDSPWDVMSAARRNGVADPVYGSLGKHLNSYHKDRLGWIDESQRLTVGDNESVSVVIDPMDRDPIQNYRLVKIPVDGSSSDFYTIEVREVGGLYEAALPGNGEGDRLVIIHRVIQNRSQPAWVIDADEPPATFSDNEGVMWREGETFEDVENQIRVVVGPYTNTGVRVQVITGEKPANDVDQDGVSDDFDNCTNVDNPDQRDSNGDGYGNVCDADLNNDGVINFIDFGLFYEVFLTDDQDADFNGDSAVNFLDFTIISYGFLGEPGPSGVAQ